jgi:fibronectin type 3 domain-containing protein
MRRISLLAAALAVAAVCAGCFDNIADTPLEIPDRDIGAPEALAAEAGNGSVTLRWNPVAGASSYRVYRSADVASALARLAQTPDTVYTDATARNGTVYVYRIAAVGQSGLEGPQSDAVTVSPAVYSVLINGGERYTGSTVVALTLTAPATTAHMMISQSAAFEGAAWEGYAPSRAFRIEGPDGAIVVHARFRDAGGALSPVVSDEIVKDTYARVAGLDIQPAARLYAPGSSVHFRMRVEDDETGGRGALSFPGLADPVALLDDGRGGDGTADDGIYEAEYRLPASLRGIDIPLAASFIDRAGNESPVFEAGTISFTDPPAAVSLIGVMDSSRTSITIRWIASSDPYFASYRIYRSESPGVAETPLHFVRELFNAGQTSYPDGQLIEGRRYYYRIFVVNDLDESAGSNEIAANTYDGLPTTPVLAAPSAIGATRATLTWSVNPDTDFGEYRLYRATQPGVTISSLLVATIRDRETTFFDDTGLDTGANTYYYRLFAVDLGGKYSRSNEVDTGQ